MRGWCLTSPLTYVGGLPSSHSEPTFHPLLVANNPDRSRREPGPILPSWPNQILHPQHVDLGMQTAEDQAWYL